MEYIKVSVKVKPLNAVAVELLMAQMGELGFDSFEESEIGLNAYIKSSDFSQNILNEISCPLDGIDLGFETETIADQNWNKVWEENYFQPIVIGDKCIIHSTFHEVDQQCEFEIIVNPQMAFGTGHHETTSLMLLQILELDFTGLEVLDMGCGTAILGMLCSLKGAKSITGVDIDEWAYNNAKENISLNNITNMNVLLGGSEVVTDTHFDIVLANINLNILLDNIAAYASVLKAGGTIIFSGFYSHDVCTLDDAAARYGLKRISQKTDNNWASVAYIKAE